MWDDRVPYTVEARGEGGLVRTDRMLWSLRGASADRRDGGSEKECEESVGLRCDEPGKRELRRSERDGRRLSSTLLSMADAPLSRRMRGKRYVTSAVVTVTSRGSPVWGSESDHHGSWPQSALCVALHTCFAGWLVPS